MPCADTPTGVASPQHAVALPLCRDCGGDAAGIVARWNATCGVDQPLMVLWDD
jgi:hypothetical protein